MVALHTVVRTLGHPCHRVLQHIGLDVLPALPGPRLFELLCQLVGAGSRCHIGNLLLKGGSEVIDRVD